MSAKPKEPKRAAKASPVQHERRIYKTPPITEAVSEFQFKNDGNWNMITMPGHYYDLVKEEYQGLPHQQQLNPAQMLPGAIFLAPASDQRVIFPSVDGKRLVSLGLNSLSVHDIAPYSGWEKFESRIQKAFAACNKIAPELTIERLAIRYLNQIVIREDKFELSDYFNHLPKDTDPLPSAIASFFVRVDLFYPAETDYSAQITFARNQPNVLSEPGMSVLLDIGLQWKPLAQTQALSDSRVIFSIIEKLRIKEREIFESVITDKTRDLFNA